jgi:peptidoglycan/xylan/chitin deacetylase (PgdA/CDA1 family)
MSLSSRGVEVLATGLSRAGLGGALAQAAGRARRHPAFAILTYHRVNDDNDPFLDSLSTEVFERQIAHVARHYSVFTVEDLVERMARGGRLPRNAVAITFDDGYRDTLSHAAPILTRHGVPATVFLASGFIGTAEVPWYDRLALGFKFTREQAVTTPWGDVLDLGTPEGRLRSLQQTRTYLKRIPEEPAWQGLDRLMARLGVTEQRYFKNAMLTWDDVHALAGLGFSIGAHTVSHPILSRVSLERAWQEIAGSRSMIADACGRRPRAFAYPNGGAADYTAGVVELVRRAGFTCAATTRFGMNTPTTSPWELRRGGPWESHLPTFALKLAWYRMTLA